MCVTKCLLVTVFVSEKKVEDRWEREKFGTRAVRREKERERSITVKQSIWLKNDKETFWTRAFPGDGQVSSEKERQEERG